MALTATPLAGDGQPTGQGERDDPHSSQQGRRHTEQPCPTYQPGRRS